MGGAQAMPLLVNWLGFPAELPVYATTTLLA